MYLDAVAEITRTNSSDVINKYQVTIARKYDLYRCHAITCCQHPKIIPLTIRAENNPTAILDS